MVFFLRIGLGLVGLLRVWVMDSLIGPNVGRLWVWLMVGLGRGTLVFCMCGRLTCCLDEFEWFLCWLDRFLAWLREHMAWLKGYMGLLEG